MESKPNLFIVGAAKCGTTYLHWLLSTHPQACMSLKKEPNFFARTATKDEYEFAQFRVDRVDDYLALFPGGRGCDVVGEASPSYLFDTESARRIAEFDADAKIIIALRDPVQRAYSHYLMDVRKGRQELPFEEAIEEDEKVRPRIWGTQSHLYLDLSYYTASVERYLAAFPREQVLVLETGKRQADGRLTSAVVAEFLGIDPDGYGQAAPPSDAVNAHTVPKGRVAQRVLSSDALRAAARLVVPHGMRARVRQQLVTTDGAKPDLRPETVATLADRFRPDVEALRTLLGADLPSLTAAWPAGSSASV